MMDKKFLQERERAAKYLKESNTKLRNLKRKIYVEVKKVKNSKYLPFKIVFFF